MGVNRHLETTGMKKVNWEVFCGGQFDYLSTEIPKEVCKEMAVYYNQSTYYNNAYYKQPNDQQ